MNLETFNLIPGCLRTPTAISSLYDCLLSTRNSGDATTGVVIYGVIPFYTQKLFLLIAVASFIFVIYAGYQMLTAFGDEAKFTQGKKTIQYALIGMFIATIAQLLVNAIVAFLTKKI